MDKAWKISNVYVHNQIQTDGNTIEVGRNYAYYEDSETAIAGVEVLEDNSDEEYIKFKLKIVKVINIQLPEGHVFECSAKRGIYEYPGMWKMKNFNMINLMSAMSMPSEVQVPMDADYIKNICKIGQHGCCRYLTMGGMGFECARLEPKMSVLIDARADSGMMNAVGKNCEGYGKQK